MSQEFTATVSDLVSTEKGIFAFDYVADTAGTASIDFLINGSYWEAYAVSAQAHDIITIPPKTTYRVTISSGTNPVVRLTPLPWHRA